ncbi:LysM peptidoglycan-binding domain-containing protein [Ferruginibacter sp. SUN002]|uniref:LysM peptidoglycan-binding domain-containing protein n=1 Tax=Ferruginibacter sp. SUN002 TaxID=2937789 RepID=UPI003D35C582
MKKIFTILFFLPLFGMAQTYTTHTVGPKESLTSIGRMYNINGRELAKLNNIDYEKGLSLGQVLKVPKVAPAKTTTTPAVVKENPVVKNDPAPVKEAVKSSATGTPIYHTVAPKETLYGISVKYGKVPIADIKKWNNLTTDGLSEGAKIIVGYSKSSNPVVQAPPVVKNEPVVAIKEEPVKIKETPVKETKIEEPVVSAPKKTETAPIVRTAKDFNGGAFKTVYISQTKKGNVVDETGVADIFKSNAGWEDGKYYCLHNSAAPGTIMKITNEENGVSIYAKVLDMVMPDIKQNNGLLLRLSNAAAGELGVNAGKFNCSVSYIK